MMLMMDKGELYQDSTTSSTNSIMQSSSNDDEHDYEHVQKKQKSSSCTSRSINAVADALLSLSRKSEDESSDHPSSNVRPILVKYPYNREYVSYDRSSSSAVPPRNCINGVPNKKDVVDDLIESKDETANHVTDDEDDGDAVEEESLLPSILFSKPLFKPCLSFCVQDIKPLTRINSSLTYTDYRVSSRTPAMNYRRNQTTNHNNESRDVPLWTVIPPPGAPLPQPPHLPNIASGMAIKRRPSR